MTWSSLLVTLSRRARTARASSLTGAGLRLLFLATAVFAIFGLGCGSVATKLDAGGSVGGSGAADSGPQGEGGAAGGMTGSDGGPDVGPSDGRLVLRGGGLGSTDRSAGSATFRLSEAHLGLSYTRACGAQVCVTGGLRP